MLLRTLASVVLLLVSGLIGWRVIAPTEVLAVATTPYPELAVRSPGATGHTPVAPLIVDGRIRVYAAKHQVKADGPVDGRTQYTARWSLRRWPQQLSGVVASGTTVVTRWSDGELVAIDARTGEIAWRQDGPAGPGYTGHRTGASVVWAPPGLRLAAGAVLASDDQTLAGYDVSTGTPRWQASTTSSCAGGFTTAGGAYVCEASVYDGVTGAAITTWPSGPWTPVGCDSESSNCAGFRDAAGQGWLAGTSLPPQRAVALDAPGATVAAGVIVTALEDRVVAQDADGAELWTSWTGLTRVLGTAQKRVVLLTRDNTVISVDPRTGSASGSFALAVDDEGILWKPGAFRLSGDHLAMERLLPNAPDDPESPVYYLTLDTVIIASL
ncbi:MULTISPECIES: PQQ-binding-like beta-propeller repeat protein [Actinoplanes]|uniref:outer membrane protein assembly factor BamB family protein n=1 Tax=Actinoplanes TaxID=1865 RepID=UPI0005F2D317|nr:MULTISPECIES: PQQ-binding-like beta-propeller repeat protein [Actinoplanes]